MLVGITWEKGKEKIINQVVTSGILIRDLSGYDSLILACAASIISLLPTQFRALIRVETLVTWACLYLVPRPRYYSRPMRFGSRGPRKFLRPRQTRRSETFCLTWGGAFGSGRAVNNFSALMKDVQQPWRVERIKRLTEHFYSLHVFIVDSPLAFLFHLLH